MTLLDVRSLAAKLNISTSYAAKLVSARKLPVVRIGRLVRVLESDVDAWLAASIETSEVAAHVGSHYPLDR